MPDPKRLYWDACVFLAAVNGEPDRVPHIDAIMDAAAKGDLFIYTSTVSIVEVSFAAQERDQQVLDEATEDKISQLWEPGTPVGLIEFHELVAAEARDLVRQALSGGWSLKPMDSIHLATAKRIGATAFHTYDTALPKYAAILGMPIEEPIADAPMLALGAATEPPEPVPPSG